MPLISLTDFVDIVAKRGTPKATKVTAVKHRPPYEPAVDFYKPLRERIVAMHRTAKPKTSLTAILSGLADIKKASAYPEVVAGYLKWWGRKTFVWFDPPDDVYSQSGVDVTVKPELGLQFNGQRHLIKLYFKSEPLAKNSVDIVTHLMSLVLGGRAPGGTTMSVLDIRNGRLLSPTVPIPHLTAMLNAELAYVAALWTQV